MSIQLPDKPVTGDTERLKSLLIYGHTKVGKTELVMSLPNTLVIDLENSAEYYSGMSINVKEEVMKSQIAGNPKTMLDVLTEITTLLEEDTRKNGKNKYDYIVIDTISTLEEIPALELANILYKSTIMGKNYTKDNVILDLDRGLGYTYLREAFRKLHQRFLGLANKCLILTGHVKDASVTKDSTTVAVRDLNLTGKNKFLMCKDVDAIGYLARDKNGYQNILSFKTSHLDIVTGARASHLSGKEFVISEKKDGKFVSYWERVFPDLKTK